MNRKIIITSMLLIFAISFTFTGCKKAEEKKAAEPATTSQAAPAVTSAGSAEQSANKTITTVITKIEKPYEHAYGIEAENGGPFLLETNNPDFKNIFEILSKSKNDKSKVVLTVNENIIEKAKLE